MPPPRFNPRPPLLAGDAAFSFSLCVMTDVSIRARHCWRAMLWRVFVNNVLAACFNPRPPLLAGDATPSKATSSFWLGFNPRPPLLAGDAPIQQHWWGHRAVSIRARHCWRAMRLTHLAGRGDDCGFNPRPPLLAGDALVVFGLSGITGCFNPRPPLLAGDARLL